MNSPKVAAAKALNATMEGMVKARNAASKATNTMKNRFTKSSDVPIGSLPFGDPKDNIVKSPDGRFFQKKRWNWYDVAASWKEIPAPAGTSAATSAATSLTVRQVAGTRKNRSKKTRTNRK